MSFGAGILAACSSSSPGGATSVIDAGIDSGGGSPGVDASDMDAGNPSADASSDSAAADASAATTTAMCGSIAVLGPQVPNVSSACVSCVDTSCCTQAATCGANADCAALRACLAACASGDDACFRACDTAHTPGLTDNAPVVTCRGDSCGPACGSIGCVGAVTLPAPAATTYTFSLVAKDYQTGNAVAGATIKVCDAADTACATPSATFTTAANGSVMVTAPSSASGLAGYLEVSGTGVVTTLEFAQFANPAAAVGSGLNAIIVSTATLSTITNLLGAMSDPTRGHIFFNSADCTGGAIGGIRVAATTTDTESVTAYIAGGIPSKTAMSTDHTGLGGILDVPAGPVTVSSQIASTSTRFGSEDVFVRAGAVTSVNVVPTP